MLFEVEKGIAVSFRGRSKGQIWFAEGKGDNIEIEQTLYGNS